MSVKKFSIGSFARTLALSLGGLVMIFPLVWMLLLSISDNPASTSTVSELASKGFSITNYTEIINSDHYGLYFFNSLLVAVLVAVGNCIFCTYVAYAFARLDFRFKKIIFTSVLLVMMLPAYVVMIPLYREIVVFGWINTYFALVMPFVVTPLGVFLMRQPVACGVGAPTIPDGQQWLPECAPRLLGSTILSRWRRSSSR